MKLRFTKYQGAGNDFVVIDDRSESFDVNDKSKIALLCDRRFGIGADGLLLLRASPQADFRMIYFNADGGEVAFCGNGARCIVDFAHKLGVFNQKTTFIAKDGLHQAHFVRHYVCLKMNNVDVIRPFHHDYIVNTGVPHYVTFRHDITQIDALQEGKSIRNAETFRKEGINVNFVQIKDKRDKFEGKRIQDTDFTSLEPNLVIRTYERGVEDETLACGTGVTACALVATEHGLNSPVVAQVMGGKLLIVFEKANTNFQNIYLLGEAKPVFTGEI